MQSSHPKNMAALRTLVERSKVSIGLPDTKELDWDKRTRAARGVRVVTDTDKDFIGSGRNSVRSDTGELERNWVDGYQIIDTHMTQAVHGWVGGEKLELKHVSFEIQTPKAAVAVSSLDGKAIGQSGRMLFSAVGRVVASQGGRMPLLSEPVSGSARIAGPAGLKLMPLASDGRRLDEVSVKYVGGQYVIDLPVEGGTHWFLLADGR